MNKDYKISDHNFWNEINNDFGDRGGVYRLFCIENGKPKPVCRLLDVDETGILYIGETDHFLDRVVELKKTLAPNSVYKTGSHIAGRRYNNNAKIQKKFPYPNLYVKLIGNSYPSTLEQILLDKYFNDFGEVPPLNANDK